MDELCALLRSHGLRPTSQRLAVARQVLGNQGHPTADQVHAALTRGGVHLSRATVYNTLHTLVEKGLLQPRELGAGSVVFERRTERHHHFVDDETGEIIDIPAERLAVVGIEDLEGLDIRDVQVVLRGRARRS
ncbi:MAG: Fur family transcriptional regulator [Pseudomonadota bacterium]